MTFGSCAADHVMEFPRPSPSVCAYCKRSKTGGVEGLGRRLDIHDILHSDSLISVYPLPSSPQTTHTHSQTKYSRVVRGSLWSLVSSLSILLGECPSSYWDLISPQSTSGDSWTL